MAFDHPADGSENPHGELGPDQIEDNETERSNDAPQNFFDASFMAEHESVQPSSPPTETSSASTVDAPPPEPPATTEATLTTSEQSSGANPTQTTVVLKEQDDGTTTGAVVFPANQTEKDTGPCAPRSRGCGGDCGKYNLQNNNYQGDFKVEIYVYEANSNKSGTGCSWNAACNSIYLQLV